MERSVDRFIEVLGSCGPQEALKYLNAGVGHRYTSLYRLSKSTLINLALHDKLDQVRPQFLAEVPFQDSFCQFVLRDGAFRTGDSSKDSRLDGSPYQGVIISYHGAPIVWAGEVWGALCHFDFEITALPDEEFELLQACAAAWSKVVPAVSVAMPLEAR